VREASARHRHRGGPARAIVRFGGARDRQPLGRRRLGRHRRARDPRPGQLDVSVGPLRPAAPSRSRSWLEHELAFANRGHRTLTFADTRTVRILDSLLVAEEGCGYSLRPLEPTCLLYLDIPSLRPGESRTRTVTLWKGLRGLKPLAAGTYVFKKTVRFQFGRAAPGPGHGHRGVIELTYKVEAGA
jgi:hypothetical protein